MKSTCGCCKGIGAVTPLVTVNRPGLDSLVTRVGTYATFLDTMLARLSNFCLGDAARCNTGEGLYPLQGLTTRDQGDPAIAMLHAFATVADVLAFYQERIANEGYLRTATERRSVLELARLVGYRLRPGVSASVYLAFELDKKFDGTIPAGTRAQSTPDPGALPQFFETGESVPGKGIWNAIAPRTSVPHWITIANLGSLQALYFSGTRTEVKPNDPLLLVFREPYKGGFLPKAARIAKVEADVEAGRTRVAVSLPGKAAARSADREDPIESLRKTIAQYLDIEAFGISAATQMAGRIVGQLNALKTRTMPELTTRDAQRLVVEVLPSLKEEARIADEGQYTRLKPWVDGLIAALRIHERTLTDATVRERALTPPTAAAAAGLWDADFDGCSCPEPSTPVYLENLFGLVTPLTRAPAQVPHHSTALVRSPVAVFDSKADTVPQLLKIFNPRLEDKLFRAWKKAAVPPARKILYPFDSVQVFRGKAALFGHNALPKPIYDGQGEVIAHEEWPLTSALFGLSLLAGATTAAIPLLPVRTQFSVTYSGETDRAEETISGALSDYPVAIGTHFSASLTATVDDNGAALETVAVTSQSLGVDIHFTSFTGGEGRSSVAFTINGHSGWLDPGEYAYFHSPELRHTVYLELDAVSQRLSVSMSVASVELLGDLRTLMNSQIYLDAEYQGIEPGSWAVIERADTNALVARRIEAVQTVSRAEYGISGKTTRLVFADQPSGNWLNSDDATLAAFRNATVYFQKGDPAVLTDIPLSDTVEGNQVELDDLYADLNAGRWVTVSGERVDTGIADSELMMLAAVEHGPHRTAMSIDLPNDFSHTTLHFAGEGLVNQYKRSTVRISANVAKATHGETREEILGSGDASQSYQQFSLKQSPLTHLAAPTPAGAENTLEVRVNQVRWHETEAFGDLGPKDRGFITRTDDQNVTTIVFGNGEQGARPPTGSENIKAVYRFGMGRIGNVAEGKINQLATKPLGLMGVVNPLPATGGADRESRDQARDNTPLAIMALDRLVSIQDYADFTRTYAGIGKASAVLLSDGRREVVHLTIAGADDIPIETTSDLYRNLRKSLSKYGDPYQPLQIATRELKVLTLQARVRIHPDYLFENVEPEIVAALFDTLGFQKRALGQDALLGEVMAVFHTVPGVTYVDIDLFDGISEEDAADAETLNAKLSELRGEGADVPAQPRPRVRAALGRYDGGVIKPAELAVFSENLGETIMLEEIAG